MADNSQEKEIKEKSKYWFQITAVGLGKLLKFLIIPNILNIQNWLRVSNFKKIFVKSLPNNDH